eukprot:CAMPEP_0182913250 /NCGR_PEP_ID=MMETSP0034_2-20130328/37942_1 /TAXON_ID=156128 /ORGANISM="Nephroselmis pyriformis, Strain CCMP717" /LENGTH=118 /DNA_ID=CAMNT_0025049963 /DNA_START=21 /DNA_END=377 /DNA_ORIENTATION=+
MISCASKPLAAPRRTIVCRAASSSPSTGAAAAPMRSRAEVLRFSLAAAGALLATASAGPAQAVECSLMGTIPCMPAPPDGKPRYTLPGPGYSPAKAAEERFKAKMQAEAEAKKAAPSE